MVHLQELTSLCRLRKQQKEDRIRARVSEIENIHTCEWKLNAQTIYSFMFIVQKNILHATCM